jgi:hypothetical protein
MGMTGMYYVEGGQNLELPVRVNEAGQLIIARLAGEDTDLNIFNAIGKLSMRWLATASGVYLIKSGPGLLGRVIVNQFTSSGLIKMYDGVATTASSIGNIKLNATVTSEPPYVGPYEGAFANGLTVKLDRAMDVTVCFL